MPPRAGRLTGFLDVGNREIRDGDLIRTEVMDLSQQYHGVWADYKVVFRNGVWLCDYFRSEKGQVVPPGYMVGELADYREYEGKQWVFQQGDEYRRLNVVLVSAIEGAGHGG